MHSDLVLIRLQIAHSYSLTTFLWSYWFMSSLSIMYINLLCMFILQILPPVEKFAFGFFLNVVKSINVFWLFGLSFTSRPSAFQHKKNYLVFSFNILYLDFVIILIHSALMYFCDAVRLKSNFTFQNKQVTFSTSFE